MDHPTRDIAAWIAGFDTSRLRPETLERARHAVLDWVGVAIAGSREPLVEILIADALENAEAGTSSVLGRRERVSPASAALINGAASHALDFDDVNWRMRGHPTVTVLPAVLTLAEQHHASGRELLEAFIIGYEVACSVGEMMGSSHYESGWHATATVGTLGAAAGASRLLGLDAGQCTHALGAAATQAAGLKAMFGTMCKPLHAGKAAMNGLLAARWAARGLTSNPDAIEAHQGLAHTQSTTFAPMVLPVSADSPLAVESGLYKYHAACYLTHASIEGVKAIANEHALGPDDVRRVRLHVLPSHRDVCDIAEPRSGLEVKFSIRHLVAMALSGIDTADLTAYSEETATRGGLVGLRARIEVVPGELPSRTSARVEIETRQGARLETFVEVGTPMGDAETQSRKLAEKFRRLVGAILGEARAGALIEAIATIDQSPDAARLAASFRAEIGNPRSSYSQR